MRKKNMGMVARRTPSRNNPSVTETEYVPAPRSRTVRQSGVCEACGKSITKKPGERLICIHCLTAERKAMDAVREEQEVAECEAHMVAQAEDENSRIWVKCCDCGKKFFVSLKTAHALEEKGWPLPKRCYHCRIENKKRFTEEKKDGE